MDESGKSSGIGGAKRIIFGGVMNNDSQTGFYIPEPGVFPPELLVPGGTVRHDRNGVWVLMVCGGCARMEIDGIPHDLARGSIVALFPFHAIASGPLPDAFRCECLYFDFDFMSDFPLLFPPEISERFGSNPCYRIDEQGFARLERCFGMMRVYDRMAEHPSRTGITKALLFTFASELLYCCADRAKSVRTGRSEMLTDDFFRLLHRNYSVERTPDFYAGRLCVTAKYLSKVLRRTTGHTASFWIGEFRIKEARQLLRSTQASVAAIAERLGFPDSSFFAKFFRRHTGCSPVEFRRGNR